jgi:hypothetical protein
MTAPTIRAPARESGSEQREERVMLNVRVPRSLRKRLQLAKVQLEQDMEGMVATAVDEWLTAREL